jgi:hypothetical protein
MLTGNWQSRIILHHLKKRTKPDCNRKATWADSPSCRDRTDIHQAGCLPECINHFYKCVAIASVVEGFVITHLHQDTDMTESLAESAGLHPSGSVQANSVGLQRIAIIGCIVKGFSKCKHGLIGHWPLPAPDDLFRLSISLDFPETVRIRSNGQKMRANPSKQVAMAVASGGA